MNISLRFSMSNVRKCSSRMIMGKSLQLIDHTPNPAAGFPLSLHLDSSSNRTWITRSFDETKEKNFRAIGSAII